MKKLYCYYSFFFYLIFTNCLNAQWKEVGGFNSLRNDVQNFATSGVEKIFVDKNTNNIYFKGGVNISDKVEVIPYYSLIQNKWYSINTSNSYDVPSPNLFVDYVKSEIFGLVGAYQNGQLVNYNGSNWNLLGTPPIADGGTLRKIITDKNGNIYCFGFEKRVFLNYLQPVVYKFDGTFWIELKQNNSIYDVIDQTNNNNRIVEIICDNDNNILVLGDFGNLNVLKFNGSTWSTFPSYAFSNTPSLICSDNNGNIFVSGSIYNSNLKYYVAKYNGTNWTELTGTNNLDANNPILSIHCDNANNIYVGGSFTNQNGYNYVAKFDGTSWSELGGANALSANGSIHSITSDSFNNIYAGGQFTNSLSKFYIATFPFCNLAKPEITSNRGNFIFCEGEDVTLTSNALNGNIWSTGQNSKQIKIDKPGQYYLNVVSSNGCISDTTYIELVEILKQNISFEISPFVDINNPEIILNGLPDGGKFYGVGIKGQKFNPLNAGLGLKQIKYEYTDAFGCISSQTNQVIIYDTIVCSVSVTDTLILNISKLNIAGITNESKIKVYPNPAKDAITVDIKDYLLLDGFNIEIINLNGQSILKQTANTKEIIIKIDSWAKGLYYLRLTDNSGDIVLVKKILIQ